MSEDNGLLRNAIGTPILRALEDPMVTDVYVNSDGRIWVNRLGEGHVDTGERMDAERTLLVIKSIAGLLKKTVTPENPVLEGELPLDGNRFAGVIPPVVPAPTFAIRRHASRVFSLEEQIECGVMTEAQAGLLRDLVRRERNILIVGGTGTGKTTIINTLLLEVQRITPLCRVFIIEDTREIKYGGLDLTQMRASDTTSMTDLLRITMRLLPGRIIVGEMRGAEALVLVKAWNSGHTGGMATIHADSAYEGLHKLNDYIEESGVGPKFRTIASTVHAVLCMSYDNNERRLSEILLVKGWCDGEFLTETLT